MPGMPRRIARHRTLARPFAKWICDSHDQAKIHKSPTCPLLWVFHQCSFEADASTASAIRPTKDVDVIVDVTSYAKYAALSERLLALGLKEDASEARPLCRWRHGDLIVDVMPIDEDVLGFNNRWYPSAIETAQTYSVADNNTRFIKISVARIVRGTTAENVPAVSHLWRCLPSVLPHP